MNNFQIFQTNLFKKQKKRLTKNQVRDLDKAVKTLIKNPTIGQQKTGDLSLIWVYKFSMVKQRYLLAYKWDKRSRTLIAIGVHENFYRDIKKAIK